MRAGREAKGKHEIGLADLATMLAAAQIGIQERGKAQVGDKTVLDALAPTVTALQARGRDGAAAPRGAPSGPWRPPRRASRPPFR